MEVFRIALLVNSRAGKGKARTTAASVASYLQQRTIHYQLFSDDWPATFESFSDIWLFGGDGTLNYFINHYPHTKTPISIFKAGTGNDFSFLLYGNKGPEDQAAYVLNCLPKPVDAGICNEFLFLGSIGIGFDGAVLQHMNRIRNLGGYLGYYLAVLRQVFSFKEKNFRISGQRLLFDQRLLLVMIHNSSRTGGGFLVSPASSIDDGLLDLIVCKPLSVWKRLLHLPSIQKGKHLTLPFIHHFVGDSFVVECEKKLPAQCDGELFYAKRFTFQISKDRFLFRY
jgi:diacylglycerol kinase family enzyme